MHQNTTHFTSKADNTQGSIGTTTIVPYGILQIHGWVNPRSAEKTGLTNADKEKMFKALWESVNDINTRSKRWYSNSKRGFDKCRNVRGCFV